MNNGCLSLDSNFAKFALSTIVKSRVGLLIVTACEVYHVTRGLMALPNPGPVQTTSKIARVVSAWPDAFHRFRWKEKGLAPRD